MSADAAAPAPLRILHLEDSAEDAGLVLAHLKRAHLGVEVRRVVSKAAFAEALEEFHPALVLADYKLPGFDGQSAVEMVHAAHPETPVIVVSGVLGDENAVALLKAGATDFVLKDRLARLGSAVRHAIADAEQRALRAKAEREREEREVWFRTLFDNAPVPTVIADAKGNIQQVNAAFTRLLGYDREEVTGQSVERITWPTDIGLTREFGRLMESGAVETRRYEKVYRHRDGHPVPAYATVSRAIIDDTKYMIGQMMDMTDLRAARRAAEEAQERLQTALRGAGAGVWDMDVAKRTMTWDRTLRQQYGLRDDQPTPDTDAWLARMNPDDRARIVAAHARIGKGELDTFDDRFRVLMADGAVRWMHSFGRIERDGDGRPVRASGVNFDVTEQQRAGANEKMLAAIMESSNDGIVGVAPDGHVTIWNRAAQDMMGYPEEEAAGAPVGRFVPPERQAEVARQLQAVQEGQAIPPFESVVLRKDGTRLEVEASAAPVRDEQGALTAIAVNVRDITARKKAQRELQRKEAELREAQRVAQLGNWELDPATGDVQWSAEVYRMCGRDPTQRAPSFGERILEEESDSRLRAAARRAVEAGQAFEVDVRLMHPQLGLRWLSVRGEPARDERGQIARLRGTIQDITERKLAEQALHETQQRFREIAETISEVFWCADPEIGRMLYISPAYEKVWGRSCQSLYQSPRSFIDGIHPDDRPLIEEALLAQRAGKPFDHEYRVVRPDGETRWVWDRGYPISDGGHVTHYVGVAVDITERKCQEADLARVNRTLMALSRANSALVHAHSDQELYATMTSAIVEAGGYKMAWVGLLENGNGQVVRPVGCAGDVTGYVDAVRVSWGDNERGHGPTGRCARTGLAQITTDIENDTSMQPWLDRMRAAGFRSAVALPLVDSGGKTFGVLNIYSGDRNAFGTGEIELLTEMAGDLAFGIVTLRTRDERKQGIEKLERSMEATVQALAGTVELRDPYTAGHQRRTAQIAVAIGRSLGVDAERLRGLELAATIHDIGKLCVPAEILAKPGRLTATEYELIKGHAAAGAEILKGIEFPWPVREIVWQHHERLDGSGYPRGLKGDAILLEARILAVADTLEAMASHRPYRSSRTLDAALAEVESGRGTRFDPAVADACLKLFREQGFALPEVAYTDRDLRPSALAA